MASKSQLAKQVAKDLTVAFTVTEVERIVDELKAYVEIRRLTAKGDLHAAEEYALAHPTDVF